MVQITVISEETQERPIYYAVTKEQIVGRWPGHAKPGHDSFPDKDNDDIVLEEKIGRKLVCHAKVTSECVLKAGDSFVLKGRTFFITAVSMTSNGSCADIEAESVLELAEVHLMLDELRSHYAPR